MVKVANRAARAGRERQAQAARLLKPHAVLSFDPEAFRTSLGAWFREHARELPWRGIRNGYATWLSEIMLQQTRVATVIDRYIAFLRKFPTLHTLAEADEQEVLALWSGLGYYRRARLLHRAAQFVCRELRGKLPRTSADLRSLPGVGDYTAAAIASIAYGESIAVVDGNVERVLLRILGHGEDGTADTRNLVKDAAAQLVPAAGQARGRSNPPGNHNQAMMELGATVCTPRQPLCLQCPVVDFCRTRGEHATPRRAPQKSRVVAHLLALRKSGTVTEVLLERRAAEASLMPRMLELPPLPLDAVENREPVLRLRHAITNTNYYVQIYTQNVVHHDAPMEGGLRRSADELLLAVAELEIPSPEPESVEEDALFVADEDEGQDTTLLQSVPAAQADLRWMPTTVLHEQPLTGLTRKVLQRLNLMVLPTVRLR